ncbi:unnamed protein product [Peronospora belbahrii]|uniref:J domain-containing protein n=1 Tax=Peronospora belbahrii TaxID=622444 RepID=A0AAU9KRM4_9STRA|nr:unnamed protein product [Peronospora belbahrii]CAH0516203.1 unnamed protein product [Peronospora belbahrii]
MAETSRILNCSTHYDVLKLSPPDHIPRFIDTQQVRKHYKELAILVHPDKNHAIDAEDAFKRLSEAYECLANELSQRNYLQQLQTIQLNIGTKNMKQKFKYRRKKRPSESKCKESRVFLSRRRTPEEIWQAFQREEEELARQEFQTNGFDKMYSTPSIETNISSTIPLEMQQNILDSNLDSKATKWATWSKPSSKRIRMTQESESTHETNIVPTTTNARDISATLICCTLCRRKFRTIDALNRHNTLSKLHFANIQAQERQNSKDFV